MITIDAHQHVWDLSRSAYPWLTEESGELNRTYDFDELAPQLNRAGVDATILVQADDDDRDTELMAELARAQSRVLGIVAYAPIHEPGALGHALDRLVGNPHVVGLRNLTHDRRDDLWMTRHPFRAGLSLVQQTLLPVDLIAVNRTHLECVVEIVSEYPTIRFVLDHLGKPPVGSSDGIWWYELIEQAAALPNLWAKVSGIYSSVGDPADWTAHAIAPFIDFAVDRFGADRLMFGGDWPVVEIAGGYQRAVSSLSQVLANRTVREREQIMGGTAIQFYGIHPDAIERATQL